MQEPFRNKKSRGYRLRPASGRDRLDSRVRRLCSRLGILSVVAAAALVIRRLYNILTNFLQPSCLALCSPRV